MGILGKPLTWISLSALAAIVFLVLLVAKLSPQLSATAGPTPAPSGLRADLVLPAKSMPSPHARPLGPRSRHRPSSQVDAVARLHPARPGRSAGVGLGAPRSGAGDYLPRLALQAVVPARGRPAGSGSAGAGASREALTARRQRGPGDRYAG